MEFKQASEIFTQDYDRINPITARKALKDYLFSKKSISGDIL
jgi:hypothetical protein